MKRLTPKKNNAIMKREDATDKLLSNMIEELKSGRYDDYIEWLAKVYGFKGCLKDAFHPKILRLYYEWLSKTL